MHQAQVLNQCVFSQAALIEVCFDLARCQTPVRLAKSADPNTFRIVSCIRQSLPPDFSEVLAGPEATNPAHFVVNLSSLHSRLLDFVCLPST